MHFLRTALLAGFPFLAAALTTGDRRAVARGYTGPGPVLNITAVFGPGLSSGASIHFPTDSDFNTTTTQRWSNWHSPSFTVTIKPSTEQDVQFIVRTANRYNVPFYATGGGHGGADKSNKVKNAINIDLSNFKENVVDAPRNRLTVGPGIAFVDFQRNLYNVGKFIPTGNAFCVNMIGATIGAAHGPYQGLRGLGIDALRSVRLITAAGDLVTASDTQNTDLFWAVKGAGQNFGIITQAVFEIFDAPNRGDLVQADFQYDGASNSSLFQLLESWDATYPREMGLTITAGLVRATGRVSLTASMTYFGTPGAAQPWVDQFLSVVPAPVRWANQTMPFWNASQAQSFGNGAQSCRKGVYNNHPSVGLKKTNAATYSKVLTEYADAIAARPWLTGSMFIQRFNLTVTQSVPKAKQGVYPGRDFSTLIVFNNFYDGPAHDEEVYQLSKPLRSQLAATSGFNKLRTYINYAYGDEGPGVWFGEDNLPRLAKLKRQWDPKNKFGAAYPIPF
ncbi:FAD-binding domain-containing protein [Cladorrhinum sp. PSN332]|nr:FAD-binding domain-containing protein [Cladorrhinum sp. PSN332]